MENYLKISEFAKLRNVHTNSLLYYERLGILQPAYIDPDSQYRYYLPEQLVILDSIQLCINLGIPLKEFNNYVEGNTFLIHKFLEDGQEFAKVKMENIRAGLKKTEYYLQCQEESKKYRNNSGLYQREIKERFLVIAPYNTDLQNSRCLEMKIMELFNQAQEQNLIPVLPAGILLQYEPQKIPCYVFLEILSNTANNDNVLQLPAASFLCIQKKANKNIGADTIRTLIETEFGPIENRTVLVTNVMQERLCFDDIQNEIQVADTLFQI